MKIALRYIRYYLKNVIILIVFSPIIAVGLLGYLSILFVGWLVHNPHPLETEEEYEKANRGYYSPW
jgi:hypothetical protein